MAGLVAQKNYDWQDSNLALFGSDVEKDLKKSAAEGEEAWHKAGKKPGTQIWRINKFKVEAWPEKDYGNFFKGDSYIILHTYKEKDSDELNYDLHFWIGEESTQDEYGTAAYKTVELDTYLDDKPIQHREVQGFESALFKSYFPQLSYWKGGVESGFKKMSDRIEKHEPKLLHFRGDRHGISVNQIPLNRKNLRSDDVFFLDLYDVAFQWNGRTCNKDEKFKATQYANNLKNERMGKLKVIHVLDDPINDEDDLCELENTFFSHFPETCDEVYETAKFEGKCVKKLYRLSDATGKLEFTLVAENNFSESALDTNDVFIVESQKELFVWIGKKTSLRERKNAMIFGEKYLREHSDNRCKAITCISEGVGKRNNHFYECFS